MNDTIKITKGLKFDYCDLMRVVDMSHEFTLKDVIRICINSKIPIDVLSQIVQCPHIADYWKEVNSQKFKNDREIEYLEVYFDASKHTWEGKRADHSGWSFHGMGKKGCIPDDILKYGVYKWKKGEKGSYRQAMAVEFEPMYKLAGLPIRLGKEIHITDYDSSVRAKKDEFYKKIDLQPTITLVDLIYSIFWELSFCGSPEDRDDKLGDLKKRVDEIDEAKKNGTLDQITVPWEKVKKDMEKKIKEVKKKE